MLPVKIGDNKERIESDRTYEGTETMKDFVMDFYSWSDHDEKIMFVNKCFLKW